MMWSLGVLAVVVTGLALLIRTTSLSRKFEARRGEAAVRPLPAQVILTSEAITHLPAPVKRYIALTDSLGRGVVTEIVMHFEATMYDAPGARGMSGPVVQYERFDIPVRLFLMSARMKGLPVTVLHDFDRDNATMRVRLAGLFNVVDMEGPDLTRTETVTILNDMVFFAPSRLADPRLSWTGIDDHRAGVSFTLGPNTVSAELVFNDAGELIDFISEDRGMLEKDGTLRVVRWTTPLGDYRDFGGWRLASEGDAIWHKPEGAFNYGHLRLTSYQAR